MKLSIIVSAHKQSEHLENFLKDIFEQKSPNFEVLLYIDKPTGKDLKIIDHYSDVLKDRLKVFMNLSTRGGNSNWIESLKKISGDYVSILYVEMRVKDDFVQEFEKLAKSYPVDIIETRPMFRGFFKWNPKGRIKAKTIFEIKENPESIAYTFPFMFNKFLKTSVIKELATYDITSPGNTKYWIELVYELFVMAKNYVYVDSTIINDWNETLESFNSTNFVKQWKDIQDHFEKAHPEYLKEIQYSKMYHFLVFLAGMVGAGVKSRFRPISKIKKNQKVVAEKLNAHIAKLRESEFKNIIKVNKYFINRNEETEFLVSFATISKWHAILEKF